MFMVDLTGSMGGELAAVKKTVLKMVDNIKMQYEKAKIRLGFVGYRDKLDTVRFEIRPFDTNIVAFKNWLRNVNAEGKSVMIVWKRTGYS